MAGIEDLIELYRGESGLRSKLDFGENRGRYWTNKPDLARYWAKGGSQMQGRLIGDILGKVKSLKIPKKVYEQINPEGSWQTIIKDDKLLKKAKTNILQTIMARAGSLTPLAAKGLTFLSSLPVATLTMVLQSTPANADEANMELEDLAKLATENNIEAEGIETIDDDGGQRGSNAPGFTDPGKGSYGPWKAQGGLIDLYRYGGFI